RAVPLIASVTRSPRKSPLFPYTTLFRSLHPLGDGGNRDRRDDRADEGAIANDRLAEVDNRMIERRDIGELAPASVRLLRQFLDRSEEHTSELQSVKSSYAVFCLKKNKS